MHEQVLQLMSLFDGFKKAYGVYSGTLAKEEDGKMTGKRASITGDVTVELWRDHLSGKQGLGVIPINENSEVKFAAIDIDTYDLDLYKLNKQIMEKKLPLVLCRTKSGGAHLYLFLSEFHDAGEIQRKMREIAAVLGFGGSEIFPKQTKIVASRGDVGNWINMPYFKAHDTQRYALDNENMQVDLSGFIMMAEFRKKTPQEFLQIKLEDTQHLVGGPPCLNHLISMGFPKGTRNNGLLNLGVYAKKVNPDGWQELVNELNTKYMDPPLDASEVMGVIKSLMKKEFFYMCKQSPIAQYCNAPKCKARKYGIGMGDTGMPKFGGLTKLCTIPPVWFLEVEGGGRMELTTDELQNPRFFQHKCMESFNIMPILPKADVWQELISSLLSSANEVPVPAEMTPKGELLQHLEDFCTSRVQAKTVDDILLGKPWNSNKYYYFRMKDFYDYLERRKFNRMQKQHITMYMKDWGMEHKFWNVRGKGVNCAAIKEDMFTKQEKSFETPTQKKEVPY